MRNTIFGILASLGLIATSFLILFWHYSLQEDPEDTIQEQWRAIKARELTKAYFAYTSKEYQDLISLKEFKELIKYIPQPIEGTLELIEVEDQYHFKGRINDLKLYYEMFLQNGVWKVDRMLLLQEA